MPNHKKRHPKLGAVDVLKLYYWGRFRGVAFFAGAAGAAALRRLPSYITITSGLGV